MKKKKVIIGASLGTMVGLSLLMTSVAVPIVSTSSNCVDMDCLKEKLRLVCESDPIPEYLDCQNILRCLNADEQEIIRECARGYSLLENETRTCNSQDLLYRSWCEYTRGAIPK